MSRPYLAFLDPPKESTAAAIRALKDHGVTTKILTGDNDKVARTICKQVGLQVRNMLLGPDLENMSDAALAEAAEETDVFAKLTPDQKARVVSVLREKGHTVGFMGDGINDAAAMKAADIGISVDTAVDVAKESADIILLEKDLMVLEQGIAEGRKTYANMIKYIKMTASSNFGNMFSVLAASALLPFLPMMSVHLILLNLIYDLSCTTIPWDNVDEEYVASPRKWDAGSVGSFMIWLGPTSSIFDFVTYIFMYFVFCPFFVSHGVLFHDLTAHYSGAELLQMQAAYIGMFQAGWFVESMWSQTLVIHMIRTPKLPFLQSHASAPVAIGGFGGNRLSTHALRLNAGLYFLADVLCVPLRHDVDKGRKLQCIGLFAVYPVVDCDKAHIVPSEYLHRIADLEIVTPPACQVFHNADTDFPVLYIVHHAGVGRTVKKSAAFVIVNVVPDIG